MAQVRAFLDANVLFSAALGGESFDLLWEVAGAGRVELLTSPHCRLEAERNIKWKYPARLPALTRRMRAVRTVPDVWPLPARARDLLPEDDATVLAAAWASEAQVLLTGDLRDFGSLMRRTDLGLRVRTVRAFLLEGPMSD